jgi:hypothetical protein
MMDNLGEVPQPATPIEKSCGIVSLRLNPIRRAKAQNSMKGDGAPAAGGSKEPEPTSSTSAEDVKYDAWNVPTTDIVLWKGLLTSLIVCGMTVMVIGLFSDVFGAGDNVFKQLSVHWTLKWISVGTSILLAALLYIFDVSYWEGQVGHWMRWLGLFAVAAGFVVRAYPSQRACI